MGYNARLALAMVVVALLCIPSGADAQNASALVLEKSGAMAPEVQPYSEIPNNATVVLQPGAKLVFLHYETCRTVTVVGSRVTFGQFIYTITGGSKPEEARTPCPPKVQVKGQGEVAGVLMRQISPDVRLAVAPTFVLVGERADDFATVRFVQGSTTLLEAPLAGRGFRWPPNTAPLVANADYELVLTPKAERNKPVTVKFRAEGEGATAAGGRLTLISVD